MTDVQQPAIFLTTHWSVVLRAGGSGEEAKAALEELCRAYWYPLYFFLRRKGNGPEDAEDLVQGFFERILSSGALARVTAEKGRFRTFLLTGLSNYMTGEWLRRTRQKRGGAIEMLSLNAAEAEERYCLEPIDQQSPEVLFEKRWAETVVARAVANLRKEFESKGQRERFVRLKPFLMCEAATELYRDTAASLGLSENGVKTQVRRMRLRFRDILRQELARTVADPSEIDEEIRYMLSCLARS
jgi:RNA polymerase sigma-70 factor (ECF subfamily)